jgi:hypothetical protein
MEFKRKCTREFTAEWLDAIKDIRIWIKSKLMK